MDKKYFVVSLSLKPGLNGAAEVVPPGALANLKYRYIVVNAGAKEAIVRVEAAKQVLSRLADADECRELSIKQAQALISTYQQPKLSRKYRKPPNLSHSPSGPEPPVARGGKPEDDQEPVIETVQTVRSGFYLVDVPVDWPLTATD